MTPQTTLLCEMMRRLTTTDWLKDYSAGQVGPPFTRPQAALALSEALLGDLKSQSILTRTSEHYGLGARPALPSVGKEGCTGQEPECG